MKILAMVICKLWTLGNLLCTLDNTLVQRESDFILSLTYRPHFMLISFSAKSRKDCLGDLKCHN